MAALLCLHAVGYLAAPVNSLAAISSDLPEDLRRRRRDALASWGTRSARRGGFVMVATAAVLTAFVGFATPVGSPHLPSIGERIDDTTDHGDKVAERREQPRERPSRPAEPSTTAAASEPTGPAASVAPTTAGTVATTAASPTGRSTPTQAPTTSVPRATPSQQASRTPGPPPNRPTPTRRPTPGGGGKP